MEAELRKLNEFYSIIGKLFYAIAASDKVVRIEEIDKIKQIVSSDWFDFDELDDGIYIKAAEVILFSFNEMLMQNKSSAECMSEFRKFKKSHEKLFTENVKLIIWKSSNSIASSFSMKNKSELVALLELSIMLKE